MFEIIRQGRAIEFRGLIKRYLKALETKESLLRYCGLHGINYTKDKVTTKKPDMTEQELYAYKVWKINKKIDELSVRIREEKAVIECQLSRIAGIEYADIYRDIIKKRFLEGCKVREIVEDYFSQELDFEDNYDKYLRQLYQWQSTALKLLQKVSEKPFIEYQQLNLDNMEE